MLSNLREWQSFPKDDSRSDYDPEQSFESLINPSYRGWLQERHFPHIYAQIGNRLFYRDAVTVR